MPGQTINASPAIMTLNTPNNNHRSEWTCVSWFNKISDAIASKTCRFFGYAATTVVSVITFIPSLAVDLGYAAKRLYDRNITKPQTQIPNEVSANGLQTPTLRKIPESFIENPNVTQQITPTGNLVPSSNSSVTSNTQYRTKVQKNSQTSYLTRPASSPPPRANFITCGSESGKNEDIRAIKNSITHSEDNTTNKQIQDPNISKSIDTTPLKDFEIHLDTAESLNQARSKNGKNYKINQMYRGQELEISLFKGNSIFKEIKSENDKLNFTCEFISEGGTKKVFKIKINGQDFAIAVPTESFKTAHWAVALKEIKSTDLLKKIGINTIPFHRVVFAEIDGVTIPAIVMPLFTNIDGHIAEHKNAYTLKSFIDNTIVKDQVSGEKLKVKDIPNEEVFFDIFKNVISDTGLLVKNNILVDLDAINYQILDSGDVKLFLFDLPKDIINRDKNCSQNQLCEAYADNLISSFIECLDDRRCIGFDTTPQNSKFRARLTSLISKDSSTI